MVKLLSLLSAVALVQGQFLQPVYSGTPTATTTTTTPTAPVNTQPLVQTPVNVQPVATAAATGTAGIVQTGPQTIGQCCCNSGYLTAGQKVSSNTGGGGYYNIQLNQGSNPTAQWNQGYYSGGWGYNYNGEGSGPACWCGTYWGYAVVRTPTSNGVQTSGTCGEKTTGGYKVKVTKQTNIIPVAVPTMINPLVEEKENPVYVDRPYNPYPAPTAAPVYFPQYQQQATPTYSYTNFNSVPTAQNLFAQPTTSYYQTSPAAVNTWSSSSSYNNLYSNYNNLYSNYYPTTATSSYVPATSYNYNTISASSYPYAAVNSYNYNSPTFNYNTAVNYNAVSTPTYTYAAPATNTMATNTMATNTMAMTSVTGPTTASVLTRPTTTSAAAPASPAAAAPQQMMVTVNSNNIVDNRVAAPSRGGFCNIDNDCAASQYCSTLSTCVERVTG